MRRTGAIQMLNCSVVDCGSVSTLICLSWIRIRIGAADQKISNIIFKITASKRGRTDPGAGNRSNLQNKTDSQTFKKAFVCT
jgi:hypothetical protein